MYRYLAGGPTHTSPVWCLKGGTGRYRNNCRIATRGSKSLPKYIKKKFNRNQLFQNANGIIDIDL